jgi:hypothetical protein
MTWAFGAVHLMVADPRNPPPATGMGLGTAASDEIQRRLTLFLSSRLFGYFAQITQGQTKDSQGNSEHKANEPLRIA